MARDLDLSISSRLNATPLLQVSGANIYYFGVWGNIEFPPSNNDKTYTLKQKDILNWPKLAYDFYRDANRAWVIWVANGISDPFSLSSGIKLRIPAPEVVNSILSGIEEYAE